MEVFGQDTEISVSREITKKFEETLRGEIHDIIKTRHNSVWFYISSI